MSIAIYLFSHYRVCRKWHQAAREETLWKKVTADIHHRKPSLLPRAAFRFIAIVPECVTHLEMNFENILHDHLKSKWNRSFIPFTDFSTELRLKFHNLQVLFLHKVRFDACGENLDLCTHMPSSTRILAVHNSEFAICKMLWELDRDAPKIEILDLSYCGNVFIRPDSFLLVPHLKQLRLAGCKINNYVYFESPVKDLIRSPTMNNIDYYFACVVRVLCRQLKVLDLGFTLISSATFREICTNCIYLTDLYLCSTLIKNDDIMLGDGETVLPSLKTICLVSCNVTSTGINSFITSCPSLKDVYVGGYNNYADCNSNKVHVLCSLLSCRHYKNVDYMRK